MKISEPLSVFLVDDDQLYTLVLKEQVNKMLKFQTTVRTFSSGEECLKHFEQPPNIVILDYFLNGSYPDAMNGSQILKKILEISPETKVIMLSGQNKIEVAVNLVKEGAYDYIIKNDNVVLRTKLAVANAANAISVSRELKRYKLIAKIVIGIIAVIVTAGLLVRLFFRKVKNNLADQNL